MGPPSPPSQRPSPSHPLSAPTRSSSPSHPSPASTTPPATQTARATPPAQQRQLVYAVPAPAEGDVGEQAPPLLARSALPLDSNHPQAIVQLSHSLRTPSYGPLGSLPDGVDTRKGSKDRRAVATGGGDDRLSKRPRTRERRHMEEWREGALEKRQWPYAEGYPYCGNVGNDVLSCYPETNSTLVQGEYSKFIWNSRYPTFIGAGTVDVYLYNADTDDLATSWLNRTNANGMVSVLPEDLWWASPAQTTDEWFGSAAGNRSTPYYFVVVDGGSELTGGEEHQATFDVIQTAAPASLSSSLAILTASSLSSVSSASSASLASASSASAASLASSLSAAGSSLSSSSGSSRSTGSSGRNGGDLQSSSGSSGLPKYAIALIVIFGVLALLAGAIAVYFCLGRARRRRREDEAARRREQLEGESGDDLTHGSSDPLFGTGAGVGGLGAGGGPGTRSQSVAGSAATGFGAGALAGAAAAGGGGGKDPEKAQQRDEDGTISQTDAARMAEAFRAALRKPPEFPAVPSADESPSSELAGAAGLGAGGRPGPSPTQGEGEGSGSGSGSGQGNEAGRALVEDELRSEGRSMKSVEGGGKRWGRQQGSA